MSAALEALRALLRKKEAELIRLQDCKGKLNVSHSDFQNNKHLCKEPELTYQTWAGKRANEFEEIRESGIVVSYEEIETTQFNNVFSILDAKILETEQKIQSLRAQIAALEAALAAAAANAK